MPLRRLSVFIAALWWGGIAGMSFNFNNQPAGVTASIGIALSARDGDNPESLIGAADRAMYLAKALGGNCWQFAQEAIGETVE